MSARRHTRRGFTLVELMVSIIITSSVALALYAVSRSSMDTFNQQQRTAEMQLRLRFAMETLRADISRAGFMATPNSNVDSRVCPKPATAVQALEIIRDPSSPSPVPNPSDNQFISPVRMRLTGNYASVDEYVMAGVSGNQIFLQNQTPQWARINTPAEFVRVFLGSAGSQRMLRITGTNGQTQFVQVTGGTWQATNAGTLPVLQVSGGIAMVGGAGSAVGSTLGCGLTGLGVGATVAPITMVEYRIGNLAGTHTTSYPTDPTLSAAKTDLIRTEFNLNPAVTAIPNATRIVGEYAVDLDAAIHYTTGVGSPPMRSLAFGDAMNFTIANTVAAGGNPQQIRSVVVRLSIRDRDQEPGFGWVARTAATQQLTRFRVYATSTTRPGAARVRTLTSEIALPNVANRNL